MGRDESNVRWKFGVGVEACREEEKKKEQGSRPLLSERRGSRRWYVLCARLQIVRAFCSCTCSCEELRTKIVGTKLGIHAPPHELRMVATRSAMRLFACSAMAKRKSPEMWFMSWSARRGLGFRVQGLGLGFRVQGTESCC